MIVTPILTVLAYFAVDFMVKDKPHAAIDGQAYPLIAQSNCRFTSGQCDLVNASFKSNLSVQSNQAVLVLNVSHALQNATIGFVDSNGAEVMPVAMQPLNSDNTHWTLDIPERIDSAATARLALQANNAFYYAETQLRFINYRTAFDKDFRSNDQ